MAKFHEKKVTHHPFRCAEPSAMVVASPEQPAPADGEMRHVAYDTEDRGSGSKASGNEPTGGRPDQSQPWGDGLWPGESPLVRFDFALSTPHTPRRLRGVGDFRATRRHLRLVWSR
jgi:hypothetical protein